MRKRVNSQATTHKNLARLDYFRGFSVLAAEKLRQLLEENKAKEKGK